MRYKLTVIFVLLFAALANAADFKVPERKILGAEQPIALGELVDLSLSDIQDKPEFLESYDVEWIVLDGGVPKRIRKYDKGIFFGAGITPKEVQVIAAVTYLYIEKDDGLAKKAVTKTQILYVKVVIGGTPPPTPNPQPPPAPDPTFPDGQFGLAKKAYDLASTKVDDSARLKGAKALSGSFDGVVAAINAGALKDLPTILKQAKDSNNKALTDAGVDVDSWDAFGVALEDELVALYKSGKLRTKDDIKQVFIEVSQGLKGVTK